MTTLSGLADAQISVSVRKVSKSFFGRPHQLEVAAAIAARGTGSTIEEITQECRERAVEAGLEPPKEGAVRKSVERLVLIRALDTFPSPRPGSPAYFAPLSSSPLWDLALSIYQGA
jgi:hypothetical protein